MARKEVQDMNDTTKVIYTLAHGKTSQKINDSVWMFRSDHEMTSDIQDSSRCQVRRHYIGDEIAKTKTKLN